MRLSTLTFVLPLALLAVIPLLSWSSSNVQHSEEPAVRKPLPTQDEIAKLPADGGAEFNRLVFESSPYLLQHARNPVDWHPWGDEAFELATKLDKPVFLSIGYSTCHWCHVMEHESFEDDEVAQLMNDAFVCIKVDREERPDVDNVYMTFAQAFGRGGWPMTVLMTAERKPFMAATYFPKHGRAGRPGMMQLVPQVDQMWKGQRAKLLEQSEDLLAHVRKQTRESNGKVLDRKTLRLARLALGSSFDAERGGFGMAPKFPVPHNLRFLLREYAADGHPKALTMVTRTLDEMRLGGIWDHVGYGFHRYSTDADWLLPHFEKMLYDQALMAMAYTEAWQVTQDPAYEETVDQIFTYVLRDMTDPDGGFYSAEDADSEGVEGLFYVWTEAELVEALGPEDGAFFASLYHFEAEGNFSEEASGKSSGHNIPHLKEPLEELAAGEPDPAAFLARVETLRSKLFELRETRIHPLKDDKILTDWNGLMIAAMAQAGRAMSRPEWTAAATKAANFAWTTLRDPETGRLYKRSRLGQAGLGGLLEDYAFLSWGLLELHQTTQDPKWLAASQSLTDLALKHFWDGEKKGFFMTADDGEKLLLATKEVYDGAIPSGNSAMLWNLCRLARLTGNTAYEERAEELVIAFSGQVSTGAQAFTQFLVGLDFQLGPTHEIVIVGDSNGVDTKAMLSTVQKPFYPRAVVVQRPFATDPGLTKLAPFTEAMVAVGDQATAYVCTNFACQAPVTAIEALVRALTPTAPANTSPGEGKPIQTPPTEFR